MCMLCAPSQEFASRSQMLRLVTLLEHPDALPPERVLHLGHRLLAALGSGNGLRCEVVAAPYEIDRRTAS